MSDLVNRLRAKAAKGGIIPIGDMTIVEAASKIEQLHGALEALYAMVKGECPSLLEDDHHDALVREALELARPTPNSGEQHGR